MSLIQTTEGNGICVVFMCLCFRNTDTVEQTRDRWIDQTYLLMIWAYFVRLNFQDTNIKKEEEKDLKYF